MSNTGRLPYLSLNAPNPGVDINWQSANEDKLLKSLENSEYCDENKYKFLVFEEEF
jgi:hypothetical protein